MIKLTTRKVLGKDIYFFSMVQRDTGWLKIELTTDEGEPYPLTQGDRINLSIVKRPGESPLVSVDADEEGYFYINEEKSNKLKPGEYFADITVEYGNGDKDTIIPFISVDGESMPNFIVLGGA